jgi:5-methyltetrahydrofolate--homocysteine methyltransferase
MIRPEYKADAAEATERMVAFWEGRELDRPCLWVAAPRAEPLPGPPAPAWPAEVLQQWTDQDFLLAQADWTARSAFWGGEAFPCFSPQLGPGSLAIHLGSEPIFWPGTIWYEPCLEDLTTGPDLRYDPHEKWWLWTRELVQRAREEGDGRYVVCFPDLIENADILASLRGNEELLVEMLEAPRAVHRYQAQILELYFRYYDELATLMRIPGQGSLFVGFPGWSPGRVCKLQCDMSCMISPGMFREHLDALLEIPRLHGIQWTPGAGQHAVDDAAWWPMLHRVQEAGKSLFLLGVAADRVGLIAREFDRNLLLMSTGTATQAEAEALLASLG